MDGWMDGWMDVPAKIAWEQFWPGALPTATVTHVGAQVCWVRVHRLNH